MRVLDGWGSKIDPSGNLFGVSLHWLRSPRFVAVNCRNSCLLGGILKFIAAAVSIGLRADNVVMPGKLVANNTDGLFELSFKRPGAPEIVVVDIEQNFNAAEECGKTYAYGVVGGY